MASNDAGEPSPVLSREAAAALAEGISLVLSRWTALQMAVENQWGGRESRTKADQLITAIHSWFTNPKPPLYIDDLEDLIYDTMVGSFHTEIEDGSVEEIAEQLMIMHEECLRCEYGSIQRLKQLAPPTNAVSRSKQVANDDDDDDDSSDEEGSDRDSMAIKATQEMDVDTSKTGTKPVPDPDGWTVVANKRNRGRRSS